MVLVTSINAYATHSIDSTKTEVTSIEKTIKTNQLLARLQAIKEMPKTNLTRGERKSLRTEIKDIKKEMKLNNGGVYLSVGAIIIIILLLILIL